MLFASCIRGLNLFSSAADLCCLHYHSYCGKQVNLLGNKVVLDFCSLHTDWSVLNLLILSPHLMLLQLGFMLLALIWKFDFPPFMVLIIAILNDGLFFLSFFPLNASVAFLWYLKFLGTKLTNTSHLGTIMTISKDRVKPSPLPDSWKLAEIFTTGVILGSYLAMMTVIFFWAAYKTDFFPVWLGYHTVWHIFMSKCSEVYLFVVLINFDSNIEN